MGEPESRGSYLKKHTTFLVTQEPQQYRVRRRFSDFEWLHSVLCARYVGMLVPSLPEKNVLKSDAFIQSRIRGLNLFLASVMQSPYLRSDEAVASFFTIGDEKEWETAKRVLCVCYSKWVQMWTAPPNFHGKRAAFCLGDGHHGECGVRSPAVAHAGHGASTSRYVGGRKVRSLYEAWRETQVVAMELTVLVLLSF